MFKHIVVYSSPADTTRHIAEVIHAKLSKMKHESEIFDLSSKEGKNQALNTIQNADMPVCLFIGSPVYGSYTVPPVMDFIKKLSQKSSAYAVPFVTWGFVTSGVALYEMAYNLDKKGWKTIGAAKVLALHSMLWQLEHPVGEGRPNADDDQIIEEMVERILKKTELENMTALPLSTLRYQIDNHDYEVMIKSSWKARYDRRPKYQVDESKCNQCGTCVTVCPTGALSLSSFPTYSQECINCYNCMRLCPEKAIDIDKDFSDIVNWIVNAAANREPQDEEQRTAYYV